MTTGQAAPLPEDPGSSGMSAASVRPVWSLTGEEILTELDALHAETCRIQTRRLALLGHLESLGHAKEIGARNTADLISRRHRLEYHAVNSDLKLAKALPKYEIVQQALADNSTMPVLHSRQAELIVTALEQAPDTVPVDNLRVAEAEMVKAARAVSMADLRRLGREALERLDPDGREPNEKKARDQEGLSLGRAYRGYGVNFKGFLANENAELFQTLIDACSKPRKITDSQGREHLDPRTKTRRQADALVHILNTAASTASPNTNHHPPTTPTPPNTTPHTTTPDGTSPTDTSTDTPTGAPTGAFPTDTPTGAFPTGTPTGASPTGATPGNETPGEASPAGDDGASIGIPAHGGIRPHIMVTIRLEDLIKAGRQHTGDLLFGDRLSASAVRMLACDAGIIPIILGTTSQPLDVGREHRSVTPAIRTALIARDKGCVVCHAPPAWCDAHHLVHWADGGNTSLDNTVLLCKPCHRATHQGTWHIQIVEGAVHVTGPHYKPRKTRNTPSERPPPPDTQHRP